MNEEGKPVEVYGERRSRVKEHARPMHTNKGHEPQREDTLRTDDLRVIINDRNMAQQMRKKTREGKMVSSKMELARYPRSRVDESRYIRDSGSTLHVAARGRTGAQRNGMNRSTVYVAAQTRHTGSHHPRMAYTHRRTPNAREKEGKKVKYAAVVEPASRKQQQQRIYPSLGV
ncbi:hypothetical protein B0H19DRAFT_1085868 [Mycena capillaripes]|nr:hypothetical protein B0H19DRAFT_1085868 [Mycena capillaripes]